MHGYYLIHYGVSAEDGSPGRGSGRYPLGSGERPYQDKETRRRKIVKAVKTGAKIASVLVGAKVAYDTIWNSRMYKFNVKFPMADLSTSIKRYATTYDLNEVKRGYTIGLNYLKKARLWSDIG